MTDNRRNALLTGLRMSICGLCCLVMYQYFHLTEGYWAVVTISAITRPNLSGTFLKALLRLSGTLLGAGVGLIAGLAIGNSPVPLFSVILLFTTATTYIGLQTKPYNYFSTVAGFSVVIVIAGCLEHDVSALAVHRTLEICLGILTMLLVSVTMNQFLTKKNTLFEKDTFLDMKKVISTTHFSRIHFFQAFVIALTASLTFFYWYFFRFSQGIWITITIFVIMEDSLSGTNEKALVRFLGQVFAAVIGVLVALFFPGNIMIIAAALGLGFFICGMIIGSESKMATMGNHAGSALAIMLLAGYPNNMLDVIYGRFFNVLAGIVIATLVTYSLQSRVFKK